MKQKAYIFDVDGTLANVDPYIHLVRGSNRDYKAFHEASVDALPNFDVVEMLNEAFFDQMHIIIKYKDLIESPNQVVEKTCNILGLEKLLNDRPQKGDDKSRSYLVSSKTSPQYKEKHFNIEYINDCYEPYTKLLSRSIDLT